MRITALFAAALLIAACPDPTDDDDAPDDDCATRPGGAMVVLDIQGQSLTFWSTSSGFIDATIPLVGTPNAQHWGLTLSPGVAGTDCDPQWTWHPAPSSGSWLGSPPFSPHCDATPSAVEADQATYLPDWCPSNVVVTSVDDRR